VNDIAMVWVLAISMLVVVIRRFGSSPDSTQQVHRLSCTREGLHVSPPAGRGVT